MSTNTNPKVAEWNGRQMVLRDMTPAELSDLAERSAEAKSEAQIIASYEKALDDHIDATAKSYGYISIITAISYAEEPAVPKFQQEGQAFRAWRSLCYAKAHEIRDDYAAGLREMPTIEGLIAEMPPLGIEYEGAFSQGAALM